MQDVLVTGGTGVLGRTVVTELLARHHRVRVLSRKPAPALPEGVTAVTGDLLTGAGLAEALGAVDAVVHCASNPRRHRQVDLEGTRTLISRAARAGKAGRDPHLLYVSIVGCDQIPFPYYRSKALAELAVAQSGLPWTVVRTTQFHDLVFALAYGLTRLPILPVPRGIRDQPIDVHDVAPRLVELVEFGASGRAADLGGPEVLTLEKVVRMLQEALGTDGRVALLPWLPGRTYAGFRAGQHLAPDHRIGRRTFEEYVAEHVHRHDDGSVRVDVPYKWRGS